MTYLDSFQEYKVGDRVTYIYDPELVFEVNSIRLQPYNQLPHFKLSPLNHTGGPVSIHYITFCEVYCLSAATKAARLFDKELEDILNGA